MARYWRCPSCGATQDKGANEAVQATLRDAAQAAGGLVRCTQCGSAFGAQAIYDGQYDAPLADSESAEVVGAGGAQPPGGPAVPAGPAPEPVTVQCPACGHENPLDALRCAQCHIELLPGRRFKERLGNLALGLGIVAALLGLAYLIARSGNAPSICASPGVLLIMAVVLLVGTIRLAVGRTPMYERHLKRAEHNTPGDLPRALADVERALQLAPAKQRTAILRQRGELYAQMGRKQEAVADLSAYAADTAAHGGSKVISTVTGIDVDISGAQAEQRIESLRADLMRAGALAAVGFCLHCRDAYVLGVDHACPNCGRAVAKPTYVQPEAAEATLLQVRAEGLAKLKARRIKRTLIWIAVGLFVACAGFGLIYALTQQGKAGSGGANRAGGVASATATPKRAISSTDGIIEFTCPSDWQPITAAEVDKLMETSLEGLSSGTLTHVGGCFKGEVGDCANCAQIVAAVALVPELPGGFTETQYASVKAATEKEMGSRLEAFRAVQVSGMGGIESKHVGRSKKTRLWDTIVVSSQPGRVYMLSCGAGAALYAQYEPVFAAAVSSLVIHDLETKATLPSYPPTAAPAPTMPAPPTAAPAPTMPAPPTEPPAPMVQAGQIVAVVLADALNVHEGPGTDYAVLASVKSGDALTVLSKSESGEWLRVACADSTEGWVSAKRVSVLGPTDTLPVEAVAPPSTQPAATSTATQSPAPLVIGEDWSAVCAVSPALGRVVGNAPLGADIEIRGYITPPSVFIVNGSLPFRLKPRAYAQGIDWAKLCTFTVQIPFGDGPNQVSPLPDNAQFTDVVARDRDGRTLSGWKNNLESRHVLVRGTVAKLPSEKGLSGSSTINLSEILLLE